MPLSSSNIETVYFHMMNGRRRKREKEPNNQSRERKGEKNNEFRIIFCLSYRRLDFAGRKTSPWHIRVSPVSPDYRLPRSADDKNHKFSLQGIIPAADDEWARRASMRATHEAAIHWLFESGNATFLSSRLATGKELECQARERCMTSARDRRVIFYRTFRSLRVDLTALQIGDFDR